MSFYVFVLCNGGGCGDGDSEPEWSEAEAATYPTD